MGGVVPLVLCMLSWHAQRQILLNLPCVLKHSHQSLLVCPMSGIVSCQIFFMYCHRQSSGVVSGYLGGHTRALPLSVSLGSVHLTADVQHIQCDSVLCCHNHNHYGIMQLSAQLLYTNQSLHGTCSATAIMAVQSDMQE